MHDTLCSPVLPMIISAEVTTQLSTALLLLPDPAPHLPLGKETEA